MRILIRGGRVVDPTSAFDAVRDICIADGMIAAVGEAVQNFTPERVIDASGCVVSPGLVDLSARLREPGFEYRATLESEMAAAVAGGVTSLVCPPDTDPPLDEPGLVEMLKHRARGLRQAHVYPLGALTERLAGERLTEMAELFDAGCIGFSQANAPLTDTLVMMRAMQYAATFGFTVWLQAEDPFLAKGGVAHDGEIATRLGLPGIPCVAETIELSRILHLMRVTGAKVHVGRLSTAEAVDMVRQAKIEGLPLTCDVGIHHVHLCDGDIGFFDTNFRLDPPLRSQRDRDALRRGLADGTIDALCSDHTPVDDDGKLLPFGEAEAGATGLELLLPLTLRWAEEANMPLARSLGYITARPANVLGIDKGTLAAASPADLCIFDPEAYWRLQPDALRSQGKHSPFAGYEMRGRVRYTLIDGNVVFEQPL